MMIASEQRQGQLPETSVQGEASWRPDGYIEGLPPTDTWLVEPHVYKIPTPLTEQGLIDVEGLIAAVDQYIDPSYVWPVPTSRHHIYWPESAYVAQQRAYPEVPVVRFRELPPHKIRVQRTFENWVHAITEPPVMPEPETMIQVVGAWDTSKKFFESVQEITQKMRMIERERGRRLFTEEQEEIIEEMLIRDFQGVSRHLNQLGQYPAEFWPFKPDVQSQVAAGQIGQVVLQGWQRKTRAVRLREAG